MSAIAGRQANPEGETIPDLTGDKNGSSAEGLSRRRFLAGCLYAGAEICTVGILGRCAYAASKDIDLHEAMHYRRLPGGQTQCTLCPNGCVRSPGEDGRCRARGNRNGTYYSLVYGKPCVVALDEVEKCPLNHFRISGKALSIATAGCNLGCRYCQNWEFSQVGPDTVPKLFELPPAAVIAKAADYKAGAINFFYTEPTVYYEYMLDVARLARKQGLKTVMVTAGYIDPGAFKEALPLMDAVTLGLKGWNEKFYDQYIGGKLEYVRETVKVLAAQKKVWWEVVNLILPSLNDDMGEIAAMAAWLKDTAGKNVPLHFTRFRPEYQLKRLPMTPAATLTAARETAMKQGLTYVYIGNLPGHEGSNTYCPSCGKMIVERLGFTVLSDKITMGRCSLCGCKIEGVWL